METKVSSEGNVFIPPSIRRTLGIETGDSLDANVTNGKIVLSPNKNSKGQKKRYKTWITTSPITGLPVITAEEGSPKLTSEEVAELLADFP